MSFRKRKLILRPAAEADLNGIRLYTQQQWGADQRRTYGALLRKSLRALVDHPELGRARDEFYPGCRGLVVGSHVVFYSIVDDGIVIDRVLHQNQDPAGALN